MQAEASKDLSLQAMQLARCLEQVLTVSVAVIRFVGSKVMGKSLESVVSFRARSRLLAVAL